MADHQPISDDLVARFLAGETDPDETERVRRWLTDPVPGSLEPNRDDLTLGKETSLPIESVNRTADADAAWRPPPQKMRLSNRNPVPRTLSRQKRTTSTDNELQIPTYQVIGWVGVIVVLIAGMGWIVFRLHLMGQDHTAAKLITLTANNQQISKTLPDGTHVVLSQHSTLCYPSAFTGERPDVTLTGEAFFDVSTNTDRVFRIRARTTTILGEGSSFAVRAYDENVSVAVQAGSIQFTSSHKAIKLSKNQQATFYTADDTFR